MAQKLPKKDVAIIGLGWTGSILANELTDEGLDVIAIERGPWRDTPTDFPTTYDQDELRYRYRHELFLRPEQLTFTFRNKMSEQALPIRDWGAFMPMTASAAAACTGTRRRSASCRPISSSEPISRKDTERSFFPRT